MKTEERASLLVTAGDGPEECKQAVGHILMKMKDEADELDVALSICRTEGRHGPKSAVVSVHGKRSRDFSRNWCGTIQWRMQSKIRKHHKRANWFVGVFPLDQPSGTATSIAEEDVTYATLRAGGPGGQHQNTTDSAVRAVHEPSGLVVVVRDGRSQHRNKALALERLRHLAEAMEEAEREQRKSRQNQLHRGLVRGNPVRRFKGENFSEE